MDELTALRTETGKTFELERTAKGRKQYQLEASTGPIHYKETYRDGEPWEDLDETYCEPSEIKGIGKVLLYPKLPNITTVFQDRCGYRIQSRSNPDHIARVELVSIDGQDVTGWQDTTTLKTYAKVAPYRVGIWKDFSKALSAKSTTMRWKITELGSPEKDTHPFVFRDKPEAFSVSDVSALPIDSKDAAMVTIETSRTRIDDQSWYWDEIIPAEARLVDTDYQVAATANDGFWTDSGGGVFYSTEAYVRVLGGYHGFTRFPSIGIPPGSTILSAYVTVWAYDEDGNPIIWMCLNDVDNASAPTNYTEAHALVFTTAGSAWSTTAWTFRNAYQSSSLATAVQEVIDRAGWASGNALMPLYIDTGYATWKAFLDYSSGIPAEAPKLTVTWNEPWNHTKHYAGVKHMAARKGVW